MGSFRKNSGFCFIWNSGETFVLQQVKMERKYKELLIKEAANGDRIWISF